MSSLIYDDGRHADTGTSYLWCSAGAQMAMRISDAHHLPGPAEAETLTRRLHAVADGLAAMGDHAVHSRADVLLTRIEVLVAELEGIVE